MKHASTHDKTLKKKLLNQKDYKKINEELKSLINNESKTILNGISFNKIEFEDLRSLTSYLMKLKNYAGIIANRVEENVFSEL